MNEFLCLMRESDKCVLEEKSEIWNQDQNQNHGGSSMEGFNRIKEKRRNHDGRRDREIGKSEMMGISFAAKLRFRSRFRTSSIDSYCFAREAFSDCISSVHFFFL